MEKMKLAASLTDSSAPFKIHLSLLSAPPCPEPCACSPPLACHAPSCVSRLTLRCMPRFTLRCSKVWGRCLRRLIVRVASRFSMLAWPLSPQGIPTAQLGVNSPSRSIYAELSSRGKETPTTLRANRYNTCFDC